MKKGFVRSCVFLFLTGIAFSGCGGWQLPVKMEPVTYTSGDVSNLSDDEFRNILKTYTKVPLKTVVTTNGRYPTYASYTYGFAINNGVITEDLDWSCSINYVNEKSLEGCKEWNFYKPYDDFIEKVYNAKSYMENRFINDLRIFNKIKGKIKSCYDTVGIPKVSFIDKTGVFGEKINDTLTATFVKKNEVSLLDYAGYSADEVNCNSIRDTYTYELDTDRFLLNSENKATFNVKDLQSGKFVYPVRSIKYKFIPETYKLEDKFISIVLTTTGNSYGSRASVKIENLTNEFIEIENVSIYSGSNIYDFFEKDMKNVDLSPGAVASITPEKYGAANIGNVYRYVKSLSDTYKLGVAVKYKIMSTNAIRTLYKTDDQRIVLK